jgi:hypothetical protein
MVAREKIVEAALALNESGLAEKKVDVELKRYNLLRERFLEAAESVPVEAEEQLPPIVGIIYNQIVDEENGETETQELDVSETEPVASAEPVAESSVEPVASAEKTPWKKGSGCQRIYEILLEAGQEGITIEEGARIAQEKNIPSKNIKGRVADVWYTATRRGIAEKINQTYRAK